MRRTFCLAAVLALVAGGLLLLPAEDRPARASGSGGSGWVHYVYDKPGTPTKSGDKVGFAEVFNMGAQIHLHALRAECSSGTRTGGAAHDRFVVVGLRVANPRPECSYSWTARSDVKSPVFHAKVRLGKRGFVAGRSEGTVKLKVYGDLGWACERSVAARNYLGGRWSAAWPPSYTPPGASSVITYKKGEDKKPLKGEDTASGSDGHVQVRFLGRINGEVMAHSQWGIDDREAQSTLNLEADVVTILRGFTRYPAGADGKIPPPALEAELEMWLGVSTPFVEEPEWLEKTPDAPDNRESEDFRSEDW